MTAEDAGAGVAIVDSPVQDETDALVDQLVTDRVASRLAAQDPTLWGPEAESEAAIRLAWTGLYKTSRPLIGEIEALRAELRAEGIDRVVLAGMGGSSLAPEVITRTEGVRLTVLDTTDPAQVADALEGELAHTVLVVSSKSGSTVETDSHRRIFAKAFAEANIHPPDRMVVVTDPESGLAQLAESEGYRKTFLADPHVGGRYSALTAFGLVPAGLAGADVARLLDQAAVVADQLAADVVDNPALRLAATLGAAHAADAEKVVLANTASSEPHPLLGFADWAEQLIAESTGKDGTGLLPVVVEGPDAPGFTDAGVDTTAVAIGTTSSSATVATTGSLGAQFLLWEHAIAVVGRLLGINPFDQPDVEAAKQAARSLLDSSGERDHAEPPSGLAGSIEMYASSGLTGDGGPTDVLRELINAAPSDGYLAIQAYLDRLDDASAALLRAELTKRSGLQTTFGWGPRFLHSTGQYHKGGHQNGVFLQITGASEHDLDVPDMPYTLGTLQQAQALGDSQVLVEHGRPVLRLHLTDRAAGLVELVRAVQELAL